MAVPAAAGPALSPCLARILRGEHLTSAEAESAFTLVMEGRATSVQIAALLVGLKVKGEVPAEVAGGVRALRRAMVPVPVASGHTIVDTCGTGGGKITTFNISTAAALVTAGAGVRVAKHGNRSFTSRCGSADVLQALGVAIELEPQAMAEVLDRAGIVFMFAPLLHPAMRHVAPVRKELGVPTIMNLLGPLTNPAGARRQLVGVAEPRLLELIAGALAELGHDSALVVHGAPGLDELSPVGASDVLEVRSGSVHRRRFEPSQQFGWRGLRIEELAGGEPAENARIIQEVLSGGGTATARAAVALNTGAALLVAGRVDSVEDGVAEAERALDAGAGRDALERLRRESRRVAKQ
ncbi:MAG: anthranilate phosphoribosyltransferase [Gemmatimonadetes bacterium]|nr:anthranilate phosphoribosyltransferase [Gemmatimonadota bacterium]